MANKVKAIILAGGRGTRLMPLTENQPKCMLKIGGKPILEHIVSNLRRHSINDISVTTHYRSKQIKEYFGATLKYLHEDKPLGNAGRLSTIPRDRDVPWLVINGDLMVDINFWAPIRHFLRKPAVHTVTCATRINACEPYGRIMLDHHTNNSYIEENHTHSYLANAGIYIIGYHAQLPEKPVFSMVDIINLNSHHNSVHILDGTWMDIGTVQDYAKAQDIYQHKKEEL